MAIQTEPTRIQIPFADSGTKNVIPDTNSTPSASQAASWTDGFPAQCSLPLSAGGIPPARADFNGIFNTMTQSERFTQEGGVWAWDATVDYGINRVVLGSDNILYWSVAQSGPNVGGAQDPTTDNGTYWQAMPMDNASLVHRTGTETIAGAKTFQNNLTVSGSARNIQINSTTVDKTVVSSALHYAGAFVVEDLNGYRMMHLRTGMGSSDQAFATMAVFDPGDPTPGPDARFASIIISYPRNGTPFATAPSTVLGRTEGTDILTRDWIPQDTRIVLTAGGNAISASDFAHRDVDTSAIYISGGKASGTGAFLNFYGPSHPSLAGWFGIHAKDSSNDKSLQGKPNGTLTWDGQTIQTSSDERLKTPPSAVPDDVLDAWEAVGWGQFQFLEAVEEKGANSARLHLGLIAQRVKAVFEERGLDACQYGILCHEEREAHEEEPAVDLWMVRYTEALAMEAVCQRRRADRAEARLASLEERLGRLEAALASMDGSIAEGPAGDVQDAENQ